MDGMMYTLDGISGLLAPLKPVPQQMFAAIIDAPGQIHVDEVTTPQPGPNEVLVQIEGCGVNPDDVISWENGKYPMRPGAPGREAWGWVAAVGADVHRIKVGERVAMLSQYGFAEYDVAVEDDVMPLPLQTLEMPFPSLVLAQAMNIFIRSRVSDGMTVAVVGAGILGSILANLSASAGANVIVLSRRQFALDLAYELGASHTVLMTKQQHNTVEKVANLTLGGMCDVVFEATGYQKPLLIATELTKEGGQLILAATHVGGLREVNLELWSKRGLDIVNAHSRDQDSLRQGLHQAIDEAGRGLLNPGPVCSHFFTLDEVGEALAITKQRPDGFLKALIIM